MDKQTWAGIPFPNRYSISARAPKSLLEEMRKIDDLLDLKFYMPTERWHVIRYPHGRSNDFVKVWECKDDPERGLRAELGMWIIEALKAGDTRNRDILKEIDDANAQLQASRDRELYEQSKDTAKDLMKVLQNWQETGEPNAHLNYKSADIKEDKCTSTNS